VGVTKIRGDVLVGVTTISGDKLLGVTTIRAGKFSGGFRRNHELCNDDGLGYNDTDPPCRVIYMHCFAPYLEENCEMDTLCYCTCIWLY
jgi:hypothetical protein